jgi:hypothetical protein
MPLSFKTFVSERELGEREEYVLRRIGICVNDHCAIVTPGSTTVDQMPTGVTERRHEHRDVLANGERGLQSLERGWRKICRMHFEVTGIVERCQPSLHGPAASGALTVVESPSRLTAASYTEP